MFFIIRCQIKKVKYKSHIQEAWLSEPEYSKWLKKDKNDHTLAFCTGFLKSFSEAAHGKSFRFPCFS